MGLLHSQSHMHTPRNQQPDPLPGGDRSIARHGLEERLNVENPLSESQGMDWGRPECRKFLPFFMRKGSCMPVHATWMPCTTILLYIHSSVVDGALPFQVTEAKGEYSVLMMETCDVHYARLKFTGRPAGGIKVVNNLFSFSGTIVHVIFSGTRYSTGTSFILN